MVFLPTGGRVAAYGSSCGPDLVSRLFEELIPTAGVIRRDWVLDATGSPQSTGAFFVIGFTTTSLVIPPTGCELLTDIAVPVLRPVSLAGTARLSTRVPLTLRGFDVRAQFLASTQAGGLDLWHTSQGTTFRIP